MRTVVDTMPGLWVPELQVHTEVFNSTAATDACAAAAGPVDIEATSAGQHLSAHSDRDTPLLDALP